MTMVTAEHIQAHIHAAKETLADAMADGTALSPVVIVIRGGIHLAHIQPMMDAPDPGATLHAVAAIAAAGFRADEIVIVTDSYVAHVDRNPLTGAEWEPNDMQDLALNHDGVAKGWVIDALSITAVNRDGSILQVGVKYDIVDGAPVFQEPTTKTIGLTGRLTSVFDSAVASRMFPPDEPPISDLVMARMLGSMGCSVLLTAV